MSLPDISTAPRDVWCSHCDQPAKYELVVTDGVNVYSAAYCRRCIARVTVSASRIDPRTEKPSKLVLQ